MPSSLTHALFPATAIFFSKSAFPGLSRRQFYRLILVASILGNFPDLDLLPGLFFPEYWLFLHRSLGHNIFSLVLLSIIGAKWLKSWVCPQFSRRFSFFLAMSLIGTHLFLDTLGDFAPLPLTGRDGIPILWPFSDGSIRFSLPLFPKVIPASGLHPVLAFALSKQFWTQALFQELAQAAILIVFWGITFQIMRLFRWSLRAFSRPDCTLIMDAIRRKRKTS